MRALLLLCVFLTGCGGGCGGSDDFPPPPPPPPGCCASTAPIGAEFEAEEQEALASYDQAREATADGRAAGGTYFSGAHLADVRNMAIQSADTWTFYALQIVDSYRPDIDEPAIADMIENHRDSLMGYVLADYDDFTSSGFNATAVQQVRAEIVDGMNAEFDALRLAI